MENELTDAQRDTMLRMYTYRVMALEVMVRALAKTHPNQDALVDAVRYFQEGQNRSLLGNVHPFVAELIQSFLDQAGTG